MKLFKFTFIFMILFQYSFISAIPKIPLVTFTSMWKELEVHPKLKLNFLEDKWAIVGYLLISSRDIFLINKLRLKWDGIHINNIDVSIYKDSKSMMPLLLEENFLGNGNWKASEQSIEFSFNEQKIIAHSKFYIIAHFKMSQEYALKSGIFRFVS